MADSSPLPPTTAWLLALVGGCLVYPDLRDERLAALDGCDEVADGVPWYRDVDGDGFGDEQDSVVACEPPSGFVGDPTDCDDAVVEVNPAADELCDGIDNDCDLLVDDRSAVDAHRWMRDLDRDGYGDPSTEVVTCGDAPEPGMVEVGGDCADQDEAVNPGVDERCDGIDNDCDGAVDEGDAVDAGVWYSDLDGDGFGDPNAPVTGCTQPPASVYDVQDCDDRDPATHPGGVDTTLEDHDCDGVNGDLSVADAELHGVVGNRLGVSVAAAGDVNGDGFTDFVAGAPGSDPTVDRGAAWLVLGAPGIGNAGMAAIGIELAGEELGDEAGIGVAGGDLDGDGYDDLLIGAPAAVTDRGSAYVVWGGPSPASTSLLSTTEFRGDLTGDRTGSSAAVGELTGDGYGDAVIGGPGGDGRVYVLPGGVGGIADGFIADLGATLTGRSGSAAGHGVAAGGDFDGDGIGDLVIGAPDDDLSGNPSGAGFLILGRAGLGDGAIDALYDAAWTGEASGDDAGYAVAFAGDVDQDGYADVLIGAPDARGTGCAYLVRGSSAPASRVLQLADATFGGPAPGEWMGHSVAAAGDVDADGFPDLIVGAPEGTGAAYLQLGSPGFAGWVDALQMDVQIRGELPTDNAGSGVAGVGDLNADGYGDLAIGGGGHDHNAAAETGAVYLLYGTEL